MINEIDKRVRKLETFMDRLNEEKIRADERKKVELAIMKARMERWRKAWEVFKVVLSPVIASVLMAVIMRYLYLN